MPRFLPALAALALAALPATAETYTLFIYETPADISLRTDAGPDGQAYWAAYADYGATLAQNGVMRGGAPLVPADAGADGLVLGGYFQIETSTRNAADTYAALAPSSVRGGKTVVLEHLPTPGMTAPQ